MKKLFLLLFPLSLAACGAGVALDEMAKETPRSACEEFTRSLLDSPSTYRLVEVSQWEEPLTGDGMAAEIGRAHSELQSLMRISYAVFCLQQKNNITNIPETTSHRR